MKKVIFMVLILLPIFSFSQEVDWVKTEGVITEIKVHRGKRTRESAIIKFRLENGSEQFGNAELFRIPFIGSLKSVGDTITVNYNKNNPVQIETIYGKFLSSYGMYILIFLGIIYSIKPLLNWKKSVGMNS